MHADRVEELVVVEAGKGAEGDRRVGRAEGRRADVLDAHAELAGDDGKRVNVRGLALVGAHAGRGVALHVLDRGEALAHGQAQVLGGDVVLEVDEGLLPAGDEPDRRGQPQRRLVHLRQLGRLGREARGPGGGGTGLGTLLQGRTQARGTVAGTGRAFRLERGAGHEAGEVLVVAEAAARLREEVDGGVPAARHEEKVAAVRRRHARCRAAIAGRQDVRARDPEAALGADHGRRGDDPDAGLAGRLRQRALRVRPQVDHGRHVDTGTAAVECRGIGRVVVGDDDSGGPGLHGEPVEIDAGSTRQHHARAVVAAEDERALDGAGREHDLASAHAPEALPGQALGRGGQVIGHPLQQAQIVVVVIAEGRGAAEHRHVGQGAQLGLDLCDPALAVRDLSRHPALAEQPAAELGLRLGQDHPGSRTSGRECCHEAGGPGADHQHVAVGVPMQVVVGIRMGGCRAEAGGAADAGLVEPVPSARRAEEGLVVEAGGNERRECVGRRTHIRPQAGPAILAPGLEPFVELDLGRPRVRIAAPARPHELDQRVRLLGTGGHDPPRPVVLEAPPDQMDAVGEQRRGEGIAGCTLIGTAVEAERQGLRPIDPPTLRQPEATAHDSPSGGFACAG